MKFVYKGLGGHGDAIMATTNNVRKWYCFNTKDRSHFNPDFRVKPGKITVKHREWAERYAGKVMVEPHVKTTFSGENKRWSWANWEELVSRSPFPLIQCAPEGKAFLEGVEQVITPTFDHAVAVLSVSRGIVTTEGGLHHAAGALGVKGVIIYGSFNSPKLFGYPFHENIEEPDPEGLGQRKTHPACVAAMQRITVERVLAAMERAFAQVSPTDPDC